MMSHLSDDALRRSYEYCDNLLKKSKSNFYYGIYLTFNAHKRRAIKVLYAWMRMIDDIADDKQPAPEKLNRLHLFFQISQNVLQQGFTEYIHEHEMIWPAFYQEINGWNISSTYLEDMYKGQIQSVTQSHFSTFSELYHYCYRVAASVGLACLAIWGYEGGDETRKLAEYRGIALQLTNILRDMYFDIQEGKWFIPHDMLAADEASLTFDDPKWPAAINKLIAQADYYYAHSKSLELNLPWSSSLSLFVMTRTYKMIFNKIKSNPSQLFCAKKVKLTRYEKVCAIISGIVQWCTCLYRKLSYL